MDKCTQCNYCSMICPHAAVRPFLFTHDDIDKAPASLKGETRKAQGGGALDNYDFRVQVSPLDCTGCELCVRICPADALSFVTVDEAIETLVDLLMRSHGLAAADRQALLDSIREREAQRSVTLIAVTGYGQDEDRRRVRAAGFDHHLVKPVDPDTLERLMNSLERPSA